MPHYTNDDSTKIFYHISGTSGPWITLVNGHTRTHKDFKMMSKALTESGYRCLSLDNRGSGDSQVSQEFTFEDMVQDIYELWQYLDIDTSHLLGISMGGMICQKLASLYPHSVMSLILISTSSNHRWMLPSSESSWGHSFEDVYKKLKIYFADDFADRNKLLVQSMAKQIWKGVEEGRFSEGAQHQRKALSKIDLHDSLGNITAPTLIIHGKEDRIIDPKAASELDTKITDSKLEHVDGAGHLLLAEVSKDLYRMVQNFIQSKQ